jgi:hypothetical protein
VSDNSDELPYLTFRCDDETPPRDARRPAHVTGLWLEVRRAVLTGLNVDNAALSAANARETAPPAAPANPLLRARSRLPRRFSGVRGIPTCDTTSKSITKDAFADRVDLERPSDRGRLVLQRKSPQTSTE